MVIKKYCYLFLLGAVANLALAPFYIFPTLFLSFSILYKELEKSKSHKQAFLVGWWFSFGYFVFGLYWVANSLLIDLRFAWLIPFAISLIPASSAIFFGLASMFSRNKGILFFAACWSLAEYVKSYIPFGGFPWNLIGYSSLFSIHFAQIASIGGIYFVSFIVVLTSLIAVNIKRYKYLLILPILCYAYGYFYIQEVKNTNITVTILQPNIKQSLKWDKNLLRKNFFDTLSLAASAKGSIAIWPEASIPYHLETENLVQHLVKSVTNKYTITSSTRADGNIYNSLFVLDKTKVLNYYDKHHLVPFGEYVPLRKILPIDKITPGMKDFTAGKQGKVLNLGEINFLPLICYEIIFPQYATGDYDFIANITNDAWFGNSTGPRQHLSMAQIRAIEQGKPVLRSANTGISAVIDPYGRIQKKIGYNIKGKIEALIPKALDDKTTYGIIGNGIFLLAVFVSVVLLPFFRKKPSL